jgi:G3E family GTPase
MTETLITAAIILGAMFVFIILFVAMHKRGHNKKLAKQQVVLADLTWKNKLDISEKETINNSLLAIDKVNFKLVYINFGNEKEEVTLVDLRQVKTAKLSTEDNSIYEQRKGKSILIDKQVSKLQLELTFNNEQPNSKLVLYQYSDGMHHLVQVKARATRWCDLINALLHEVPHLSRQSPRYA